MKGKKINGDYKIVFDLTDILPANSSIALDSSLSVPQFPFQGQGMAVGNGFVQLCDT